jgi:hypothetical protein
VLRSKEVQRDVSLIGLFIRHGASIAVRPVYYHIDAMRLYGICSILLIGKVRYSESCVNLGTEHARCVTCWIVTSHMHRAGIPPGGQDILAFYQSDAVKGVYKVRCIGSCR